MTDELILGVDPGLRVTGYGLLRAAGRELSLVEAGVIRTDDSEPLGDRLRTILDEFRRVIGELQPGVVALEELYSHYKHPTTAILMGHARGVIVLCCALEGRRLITYSPTRVKSAVVGNGHASKEQVQKMVKASLGLSEVPEPADVADALALALCHANQILHPSSKARERRGR